MSVSKTSASTVADQHSRVPCRITKIETIPVRYPFQSKFKIASGGAREGVDVMLVRLHTDQGVVGIGETQAWMRYGSRETLASLHAIIHDHFSPRVVGRSPFDIAAILHELEGAVWHSNYAQAPIADALFDLQGKLLGVPVYQLLGGKCRDRLAGCATLGIKPSAQETIEEGQKWYEQGFRSFTIKVGNDPMKDVKTVLAFAEHFGDTIILRADGNAGMTFPDALRFADMLKGIQLDALEQLIEPWDIDGMASLARRFNTSFMADEAISSEHDLLQVIKHQAASTFQTKIAKNGGLWNCRKLWQIGAAAGMRIFPGNHPGGSIVTASVLHLAAAWPGELLEGPFAVGLMGLVGDEAVANPIELDGPYATVSDAPGLGLELDDAKIRRLKVDA